MALGRRFVTRLGQGLALLLAIVAGGLYLLPSLVDLAPVRSALLAELSRRTGARLSFEQLDLRIYPFPAAVARKGRVLAGWGSGTVDSAVLSPGLGPLLTGRLQIANARLSGVALRLERRSGAPWELPGLTEAEEALTRLARLLPGVRVTVTDGRVDLVGAPPALRFRQIEGEALLDPARVQLAATARANFADRLSLRLDLVPSSWRGRVHLEAAGLRSAALASRQRGRPLWVEADGALELDLASARRGDYRGDLHVEAALARLWRGERALDLSGLSVRAGISARDGSFQATVEELRSVSPGLRLSGKLEAGPKRLLLEIGAARLGVAPARLALAALAGDAPAVRRITEIVTSGDITDLRYSAQGSRAADLVDPARLRVAGVLHGADLALPWWGLRVRGAGGEAAYEGGVLSASSTTGRWGASAVEAGRLSMVLGRKGPLRVELEGRADLAEVASLLRERAAERRFTVELRRLADLKGWARGTVVFTGTPGKLDVAVDAAAAELGGRYDRLPGPFAVQGGPVSYRTGSVRGTSLSGRAGASTFTAASASIVWGGAEPRFAVEAGASYLLLDEIYPWASRLARGEGPFRELARASGGVRLQRLSLAGSAKRPSTWQYRAAGSVVGLVVDGPGLPGRLGAASGAFEVDRGVVRLTGWRARLLDGELALSARLLDYRGGRRTVDVQAQAAGSLGPAAAAWAWGAARVPERLRLRAPFRLESGSLAWKPDGRLELAADVRRDDGPRLLVDLGRTPERVAVRRFTVEDAASKATLSGSRSGGGLEVAFRGRLSGESLSRLFAGARLFEGSVEGDVSARWPAGAKGKASARGWLAVSGLQVPGSRATALVVESARVRAEGERAKIEEASVRVGSDRVRCTGTVTLAPEALRSDLTVEASELHWETLRGLTEGSDVGRRLTVAGRPVEGTATVRVGRLLWGGYGWAPVRGVVRFGGGRPRVEVTEAALCGVSTPGTLEPSDVGLRLSGTVSATRADLAEALSCLWGRSGVATGRYTLEARVSSAGPPRDLLRAAGGDVEFSAEDGRIFRYALLARVFALLNLTEVFRGRLPDLAEEGFGYRSVRARGSLKGGRLVFSEGVMDGRSMKLFWTGSIDLGRKKVDLTVIVAPLKTVDAILGRIPVLNYLVGRSLVSIPVRVTGDLADPTVVPLTPSAVGSALLGLMKRTLLLPFHLVQPLVPEEER